VLKLRARVRDLKLDDNKRKLDDLYLQIPSANVTDMSIYNQYLPDKSPLRLLGGEADLTSYIHLQPDSAVGFVKLNTLGLRSRLNEQDLSADLVADIRLSNGRPENLEFDISGSTLFLENVRVAGANSNYKQQVECRVRAGERPDCLGEAGCRRGQWGNRYQGFPSLYGGIFQ
jgi:hypothetical protein